MICQSMLYSSQAKEDSSLSQLCQLNLEWKLSSDTLKSYQDFVMEMKLTVLSESEKQNQIQLIPAEMCWLYSLVGKNEQI